ncbi:Cas8a1 family CRISPR/Cas system-associated protein [Helcococcus kunzii]|uniref:Cas8a1 family CRISPR/Cas system-associated protein n=1 Tax=Helcococcus kunzii TaxID=40091 RepID=UPI0024AD36B6|nr:Cas8a1 family CRISPR/Cas system-associated protein [Helcococcus kunzii]
MDNKIHLNTSSWLYNVGMLGMYNILKLKNGNVDETDQGFSFDLQDLENFEEYYFKYLIDKYKKTLSITKITSFENVILHWENEDYKNFTEKSLETLNNQIVDVKRYIKSNSYKSAYVLVDSEIKPLEKEKDLKKVNIKKKENIEDKIEEIKEQVKKLKDIINYFNLDDSVKYIGAKNVIYTYIRNAWDGVSILNRQNKNPDMYDEISNYFIKPAMEYLRGYESEKSRYKYSCMSCNSRIKNLENDIGFIREMGFDVNRKTSHVYDFNNYVGICPMCKLVYSCIPAGFTYAFNRGVFVNYSSNFKILRKINKNIENEILKDNRQSTSVYGAIQKSMDKKFNDETKFELSDIQVVRYFRDLDSDKVTYSFNIISRQTQKVIKDSRIDLDFIRSTSFDDGNLTIYIYNEVMKNLFNNQNNFLLTHKMLHYKLSNPDKTRFNYETVYSVIKINDKYLREVGYMKDSKSSGYLHYARKSGESLRGAYIKMGSEKRLEGVAYRMLNALKTSNKHAFMDTLLNSSMYANQIINQIFSSSMEDDLKFKNAGYAFITGLLGTNKIDEKQLDKGEENE